MEERENITGVEKEKNARRKILMAVAAVLVLCIAIFAVMKVYNSPTRQLEKQLDLGNRYLEEMDYEQAIVAFDKAIEIDPKNADAYLGKADAYIGLGDSAMAIETLEIGYQAAGEDEAIASRLLVLYVEMAEEAIETGSYEEGMKAYERIVELSGEDEKLRDRLEALRDYGSGEEDTSDETVEGECGLPYFELGFSPEDFTIAGYSVMDGDHLDDVERAAAEVMPSWKDVIGRGDLSYYEGWYFNVNNVGIDLCYHNSSEDVEEFRVEYDVNSDYGIMLGVSSFWWSMPPTEPFLYKGKVIPNVTSYEETLENLGIESLMQFVEEKVDGEDFWFESQYGTGCCGKWIDPSEGWSEYYYFIGCNDGERAWNITFCFHDDIVCMVQVEMHKL